jgi:hypothetical protein
MRTTCYRLNDADAKCYRPIEHSANEIPVLFDSSAILILKLYLPKKHRRLWTRVCDMSEYLGKDSKYESFY